MGLSQLTGLHLKKSKQKRTEKKNKKTWSLDRPKSLLSQLTGLHLKKSKQKKKQKKHGLWTGPSHCYHSLQVYIFKKANRKEQKKTKKHGLWTGPSHCYHSLQVYILKKANRKKTNKKNMVFGQAQVIAITAYRFTS